MPGVFGPFIEGYRRGWAEGNGVFVRFKSFPLSRSRLSGQFAGAIVAGERQRFRSNSAEINHGGVCDAESDTSLSDSIPLRFEKLRSYELFIPHVTQYVYTIT